MDKTIIAENSAVVYMRDRWQRGAIGTWELLRGAGAYLQYKFGVLDIESWGVDNYRCTKLEVEEGILTGRVVAPMCFEEGRIYWLQDFIESRGTDLARSWFFDDPKRD